MLLLARLVTGKHWPQGWSSVDVKMYLQLLEKLSEMLLAEEKETLKKTDILKVVASDLRLTIMNYELL